MLGLEGKAGTSARELQFALLRRMFANLTLLDAEQIAGTINTHEAVHHHAQTLRKRTYGNLQSRWQPSIEHRISLIWNWDERFGCPTAFNRNRDLPALDRRHRFDEFRGPFMRGALWNLVDEE